MDGWMGGWKDEKMDGWTDGSPHTSINPSNHTGRIVMVLFFNGEKQNEAKGERVGP